MAVIQQGYPSYAPTGPGDRGQSSPPLIAPDAPNRAEPHREEPDLPDYDEPPPPEGGDEAAR